MNRLVNGIQIGLSISENKNACTNCRYYIVLMIYGIIKNVDLTVE